MAVLKILESLQATFAAEKIQHACVAYSGGLDSHVLLHACQQLKQAGNLKSLRVIHINHQIHADAANWAVHCQQVCVQHDIPIDVYSVTVKAQGQGLEAAARTARYQTFAAELQTEEVLLTAHHQDDQAETLLLQLLRGAGPAGLAAMPEMKPFANGRHGRPLLAFSQRTLAEYAQTHGLLFIDDPSNACLDFDRNYLRHEVLPQLSARFPAAISNIARSARHCGAMHDWQQDWLGHALKTVSPTAPNHLNLQGLSTYSPYEQSQLLRYWLKQGLGAYPATHILSEIETCCIQAELDANPMLQLGDKVLRRYRQNLYLLPAGNTQARPTDYAWPAANQQLTIPDIGKITLTEVQGAGLAAAHVKAATLRIGFRRGGERIRPVGHAHTQSLKKLLQSAHIPPWQRDQIPLIYVNGELAAVLGHWVSGDYAAGPEENGVIFTLLPAN